MYRSAFLLSRIIQYSLAENTTVRLSVYDVLGREVAVLVNEFKTSGSYEVSFSGDNLSTGVYYYRIDAGSFTDTKKMLMIK